MSEVIEQDNLIPNYSFHKRSNISLEKSLDNISVNKSESLSIINPTDDKQKVIVKFINNNSIINQNFIGQNENTNYKSL